MKIRVRAVATVAALAAVTLPLVAGGQNATAASMRPPTTCFWSGLIDSHIPRYNFAFPDTGSIYWTAQVSLPLGSRLILKGRFPHARYMSLNSYNSAAAPTDAIHDASIKPDGGSHNPFLPGARRTVKHRSYTVTVLGQQAPATGARMRNTLYAGVPGDGEQRIIYRVYVPDHGYHATGGVGLPAAELHLADGHTLRGASACAAMDAKQGRLPLITIGRSQYEAMRDQPGKPGTFPATRTPTWQRFWNPGLALGCLYQFGPCTGTPAVTGGQYSNKDNAYVFADVNLGFGKVLVLQGKLPTTPRTQDGARRMGAGQVRYWSICQNQWVATTRGGACLYDAQVPVDRHGNYTIVTSRPSDRPRNATNRCGVGYLPWPAGGDGAGHPDEAILLIRNMLPASTFHHAIQNVATAGTERSVIGPFLPKGNYTSKAKFQRRGCDAH